MKPSLQNLQFTDNPAIRGREANYVCVRVDVPAVLKSWKLSLYSFEWLARDGTIKAAKDLPPAEQPKRLEVEGKIGAGQPLERPVLGIGILENVEIGSGRAVFMTAAALGAKDIPVHIPRSHEKDFKPFLSRVQ